MKKDKPTIKKDARFSVAQAAEELGISRQTIYRAIRSGMLQVGGMRKCNGKIFIFGREVERYWNECY